MDKEEATTLLCSDHEVEANCQRSNSSTPKAQRMCGSALMWPTLFFLQSNFLILVAVYALRGGAGLYCSEANIVSSPPDFRRLEIIDSAVRYTIGAVSANLWTPSIYTDLTIESGQAWYNFIWSTYTCYSLLPSVFLQNL